MPPTDRSADTRVKQARSLARAMAPDLGSIVLTHFEDAETLDTLRPGETDLDLIVAINRAVAAVMAEFEVEVLVQRADRAAFRRWLDTREDTPAVRRAWVNRSGLLRGTTAFKLLGMTPPRRAGTGTFAPAPGPIADKLLAAFENGHTEKFDSLAQGLLAAERGDVLEVAVRKLAVRAGSEAGEELLGELLAISEAGPFGPAGWASLVALSVALPAREVPDAEALGAGLLAAGVLDEAVEVRFLPGWRGPDALTALSPLGVRRVLLDLVEGREPRDLPIGDTDDLAAHGFGLLLGVQYDWAIPVWDSIAVDGFDQQVQDGEEEAADSPEEAARAARFDAWRGAIYDAHGGCVPLALVPVCEAAAEIDDFLAEAAGETGVLEDIREFVAMARRESGGEEVVCRVEIIGDSLEMAVYTEAGRFMDSLTLGPDRLPVPAVEMAGLIGGFVRVVKDTPGR